MPDFDFDELIDRRGTDSIKWDVASGELPMWVADMDFRVAPPILAALRQRLDHGVFGYSSVPESFGQAIAAWWARRHDWTLDPSWVRYSTGVVPAISSIVRSLTAPAEGVVIAPPVYNIFFNSIRNSGRTVVAADLRRDAATGVYEIDWEVLAAALARPDVRLLVWCNPHNPVGRLWSAEELARVGALARAHDVIVLSDEIHCDLVAPGHAYVPFVRADPANAENSITAVAPTKAFNIAGLQVSAVIVPDRELRTRVTRGLGRDEVAEPNAFAIAAAVAAFTEGEGWLDQVRAYIQANKRHATEIINATIPGLRATESLATYLLWVDTSGVHPDSAELAGDLRAETGLFVSAGAEYGGDGAGFVRMNLACPGARLDDGLLRLQHGIATIRSRVNG